MSDNSSRLILLHVDRKTDFYKTFFLKIKQKFTIPILENWSRWLYERLLEESMIEGFTGNVNVIKIAVEEADLQEIIKDGIKQNAISF